MARSRVVLDDFRVQVLRRAGGGVSYTILWPGGSVDEEADGYLRPFEGSGSQKTYAYALVDHFRWRVREGLTSETITLLDLQRYMGAVGAKIPMPYGQPWRMPPKRPYGKSALQVAAACLKGFYLHTCSRSGSNPGLVAALSVERLSTKVDTDRALLGHIKETMPANPLAPARTVRRRHPKMLPEQAKPALRDVVNTARDAMVVQWLADTTLRIGGLTGLHLVDLHLRENAACNECQSPHLHVCHRWGNPNGAAAKIKPDWKMVDGVITGGEIYRVSPAMISSYFQYMTTEYAKYATKHGMLLIQLTGPNQGEPWTADAARGMLRRAGRRAQLPGRIRPQAFRHQFTNDVMDASGGDPLVAKAAGNWASMQMVDEVYGHPDLHSPEFTTALKNVWGEEE
ncbi:tyrosine-type recombinase/integrase [Streptomyces sp. SID2888]|nr:tyrosine-type recombinase/integrase [Streptomyces sp. SID2888]